MASVEKYQLKSGADRWRVRYDAVVGGKRKQLKKDGFRTQRDARRFAARVDLGKYEHTLIPPSALTLRQYAESYLEMRSALLAPKTRESYRSCIAAINASALADMPLQQITPEDIDRAVSVWLQPPPAPDQEQKGRKPRQRSVNTVQHYLTMLKTVFASAAKSRKIAANPCLEVDRLKVPKHEHNILTVEEYNRLLEAAHGTPMYAPILLAGWMGLRRGEALGLTWNDVDIKDGSLKVRQCRQVVERQEIIKLPKSETSRRTLKLPPTVAAALKELRPAAALRSDYICCDNSGKPLPINAFAWRFKAALKAADLPENIRFHDLRHTCAALLTAAGASPKEISDYLGHSGIGITMDLYADIFDSSKEATANRLDSLITAAKKGTKKARENKLA